MCAWIHTYNHNTHTSPENTGAHTMAQEAHTTGCFCWTWTAAKSNHLWIFSKLLGKCPHKDTALWLSLFTNLTKKSLSMKITDNCSYPLTSTAKVILASLDSNIHTVLLFIVSCHSAPNQLHINECCVLMWKHMFPLKAWRHPNPHLNI